MRSTFRFDVPRRPIVDTCSQGRSHRGGRVPRGGYAPDCKCLQ